MICEVPTLFRMPLDDLLLTQENIPIFLPVVCAHLREFSRVEGIFRHCGAHLRVQTLGMLFNLPECAVPPSATVHDLASFLKQWLAQLPEPLIPPALIRELYGADSHCIVEFLKAMPIINRKCIAAVFSVLREVLGHASDNRMGPSNLAVCFYPGLTQESQGPREGFDLPRMVCDCSLLINDMQDDFDLD